MARAVARREHKRDVRALRQRRGAGARRQRRQRRRVCGHRARAAAERGPPAQRLDGTHFHQGQPREQPRAAAGGAQRRLSAGQRERLS